jgi:hypothetical protein
VAPLQGFGWFGGALPGVPALEKQRFHPRLWLGRPVGTSLKGGFDDREFESRGSDVKPKVDDVTFLHDVFLSLNP